MKHSITDEQVHQIFKHAETVGAEGITENLKTWFPKSFVQKGRWYITDIGFLICFSGNLDKYDSFGFDKDGNYRTDLRLFKGDTYKAATSDVVIRYLLAEAQSRGFLLLSGTVAWDDETNAFGYYGQTPIFVNGKWTEKIVTFEPVNKWYKHKNGILRYFHTRGQSTGFNMKGTWNTVSCFSLNTDGWTEASELDVHFALMAYAYANYKPGENIMSAVKFGCKGTVGEIYFDSFNDIVTNSDGLTRTLFNSTTKRWAEKC